MRGGKRLGSGRKKLNHIRKTFYVEGQYIELIDAMAGRTISEKNNNIYREFFKKN